MTDLNNWDVTIFMLPSVEEMGRFVSSLGKGGEVKVLGASRGPAGRLIQSMFRYINKTIHTSVYIQVTAAICVVQGK